MALKTIEGYYVTAEGGGGGEVTATRLSGEFPIGAWETFELIILEGNKVAFMTHNGHFLTADSMRKELIVADRNVLGEWEKFDMLQADSVENTENSDIYSIETFGQIGHNVLVRVASSNNFVWVGEYGLRRSGGYEHHDNWSRLWYTTDGKTWREGGAVYGYESINSITATRDGSGVNIGTEQGPEIFSVYEQDPNNIIFRFKPEDGRYTFVLAIDDAGSFGELATINAPDAKPKTRLAGYFDDSWQWSPYPEIPFDFMGWDLIEWYGWLLIGGSGSWPRWEEGAGQIVGTKHGWSHWESVLNPSNGKGCFTLTKINGTLIASFASEIWWTTDPGLKIWHQVDVPGYWNWNLVKTSPETVIGLWYADDRWPSPEGNGVWLVEFNFVSGDTRIIHKWNVVSGSSLPFYVGGGLVNFGNNTAIGFYSSGGKSHGIRITW